VWGIVHDRDSAKRHESPWRMIMSLTTRTTWRVPTPIDQLVVLQPGTLATSAMRTAATDGPPEHNLIITDGGDVAVPLRGATHARPIAASRDGTPRPRSRRHDPDLRRPRVLRRWRWREHGRHAPLTPRALVMTRLGPILGSTIPRRARCTCGDRVSTEVPAPRTPTVRGSCRSANVASASRREVPPPRSPRLSHPRIAAAWRRSTSHAVF
jgi:hypothetical protein